MSKFNANDRLVQIIDLASISADADVFGAYFPQKAKIVSAKLVNGANIAQSDTDKAVVQLKNGSVVLAEHSTALTGALVANTPAAMTLASALVVNGGVDVAAGSWLKANYDESGTYAMTNAKLIVEYYNS